MSDIAIDYRSVTDIVTDTINPGAALARHANKEGLEGRGLFSEDRQEKMQGGTEVHTVLEALRDHEAVDTQAFPAARRGYARGILRWHGRFDRKILMAEVDVSSVELRIKGRIDYVRACQKASCPCGGEGVVLGDLKVGKLVTFVTAHLQVGGYHAIWLNEEREQVVCGGEVLCVNALGDFKIWPSLASPRAFFAAADWHEELAPLRSAVEMQRDAR